MSKQGNSEPEAREPAVESTHTTQHVSHNQASARAPTCLGARQSGPCLSRDYAPTLNSTQRRGVITSPFTGATPGRAAGPRAHIILPIPVRSLPYVLHPPSLPSMAPHVLHAVSDAPLCCPLPMRPEAGRASYRPRTGTGLPSPPPRALHTAHAQDITRHDATLRLRASCVQHTQPLHPAHLASVHALFRCSAKIELPPCVSLRRSPPSRVAASRMDQW
jgi:hypothetical protein